jgi:hypothetical protein
MRGRRGLHRFVAQLLVEMCSGQGIGAKPKERVAPLGAGLEMRDQRASKADAAIVGANVEVAKAADVWILYIRVGRYAADADELIMGGDAEKELTPVVKTDSLCREIVDKPLDEVKAFGLTGSC